jgi:hypothetical protein
VRGAYDLDVGYGYDADLPRYELEEWFKNFVDARFVENAENHHQSSSAADDTIAMPRAVLTAAGQDG